MKLSDIKIGVIGLGYVGLPLAVEFGRIYPTIGFDINAARISELNSAFDRTFEVSKLEIQAAKHFKVTNNLLDISSCNVFIITVPTPVDERNIPNLNPLFKASEMIGKVIKSGSIVIYESTVYPGATEEECIPIIEKISNLTFNVDFFAGYSPERINPGDKERRFSNIKKVTSGSTQEVADFIDLLYSSVISAGTFKAASIRVAEAAKVIENTQRDVNIALINELAIIFNKLGINTKQVLEAASTKWNFFHFVPGLVGGHCIGVDPYYMAYKAQSIGYLPQVILAGRRVNDGMGRYVANQVIKLMVKEKISFNTSKILVMGLAFKENCPDLRNSRVIDVINELKDFGCIVDVYDPIVSSEEANREYNVPLIKSLISASYDAIVLTVPHKEFLDMGMKNIRNLGKDKCVIYDLKSVFPANFSDGQL
ncbi:WecC UDP-N-acetyl-D-mannosaminuronate dehydrogenase [Candidatus Methylopumilus universalis]|uniref:nucleotide sugar dehydrogenase n=1 Tax=Candidatus Methylopumilus universalis TaxID=2588536 RepID=UPI003BEF1032